MLNPFPIQFLALLAYFILRICVGFLFVSFGLGHLKRKSELPIPLSIAGVFGFLEVVIGGMFIVGFYTQIAALAAMILSLIFIWHHKKFVPPLFQNRIFYILLFACSLSLFITGAGAFALDLSI